MRRRFRKQGSALVFTFMLLTLLVGFVVALQEVSVTTYKITESRERDAGAENLAEMGVDFFIYHILQEERNIDTGASDVEQQYQNLGEIIARKFMANPQKVGNVWKDAGEKKHFFGQDGGWFRLILVEALSSYSYRIVVAGGLPTSQGQEHMAFIEAVVGSHYDAAGSYAFTSVTTPRVKGNNNWIYRYGGNQQVVFNSPSLGEPDGFRYDPNDPLLSFNFDEDFVKARMEKLLDESQKRIDSVTDLVRNATLVRRTGPTMRKGENNGFDVTSRPNEARVYDFGSGDLKYAGQGQWRRCGSSKCNDWHWYARRAWDRRNRRHYLQQNNFNYSTNQRTFVFGRPGTWSNMLFDNMKIQGNNNVIRFYPGVYYFSSLEVLGNGNKIFLDTTTGPVYIVVSTLGKLWAGRYYYGGTMRIQGNNNALVVLKDKSYSGTDLAGRQVNPSLRDDYYTAYTNKVDSDGDFTTVGPDGRKLAEVFVGGHTGDIDFLIDGNNNLIGALAVGSGGSSGTDIFKAPAIDNDDSTLNRTGSEVKRDGNKLRLIADAGTTPPVSSEQFRVWGRGYAEINIRNGNHNTLVGGYLFANCRNHAHEFLVQGNHNTFYGAVSIEGRFLVGKVHGWNYEWANPRVHSRNKNKFYFDVRFYPFPPSPSKKTMHVKFKRRLSLRDIQ